MTAEVVPLRPAYGASAEEWWQFELLVGAADLLPVVSNPHATISEDSSLKSLGKTPSIYNRNRRVAGLPKWTSKQSTPAEVATWSKEADYGICIQTRRVRALDIDIPDPNLADRVENVFLSALALSSDVPVRLRQGTGKRLLAFELVGSFAKRSFKVDGGLVEFLADGQQFVACGTHPSGQRYEWAGGVPTAFPAVSQRDFEAAWAVLVDSFALAPATEGAEGADRSRADLDGVEDEVAAYLEEHGLALGHQGEKVFVSCPWKDGHTSDSGISESAWLVAGTRGFERGHYQCMHASCQGRTDEQFLDAVGYRVSAFRNLDEAGDAQTGGNDVAGPAQTTQETPSRDGRTVPQQWPPFKRDSMGRIEPTLTNVERALARPDICGVEARFDTFRDDIMVPAVGGGLRSFKDSDGARIRRDLEQRNFKPVGRELLRDALLIHADDNQFDSAQEWLKGLEPWDGVERVERFFPGICMTDDTPYTMAVGRYLWTALAGRIMEPGCQADMVPILQSDEQGYLKSSLAEALAPEHLQAYRKIDLDKVGDDNLSRRLRGCIVGELDELRGLRTKDAESIRAWITQREERWVPKFYERDTVFKRRCVFFATANPEGLLADETGERRWLPMKAHRRIDLGGFLAMRNQLWAEGLWRWRMLGIEWQDAERLAAPEHAKFKVRDDWQNRIEAWLQTPADVSGITYEERGFVRAEEVGLLSLGLELRSHNQVVTRRIAACMRNLGWKAQGHRVEGRSVWAYVRIVRACETT